MTTHRLQGLAPVTFPLRRGELLSLARGHGSLELVVEDGLIWVTGDHEHHDIILPPGSEQRIEGGETVLIEALEDARVRVRRQPAPTLSRKLVAALH